MKIGGIKRINLLLIGLIISFLLVLGISLRVQAQKQPNGTISTFSKGGNAFAVVGKDGWITVVDVASDKKRVILSGDFGGGKKSPGKKFQMSRYCNPFSN